MFRTSSPGLFRRWLNPGDDDDHGAYESYAVSDEPRVSVGVALELGDCNVGRGSSSSGLDV